MQNSGTSPAEWQHLEQGKTCLAQGRIDQAEQEFQAALALNPRNADAHFELGKTYYVRQRWAEAAAQFEAALAHDPAHQNAHLLLAKIRTGQKEYDAALKELEAARAAGATATPDLLATLGTVQEQTGAYTQALAAYAEALRLDPGNMDLRLRRVRIMGNLKEYDAALKELAKARAANGITPDLLAALGAVQEQSGAYTEALATYAEALRLEPGNADLHLRRVRIFRMNGDGPAALAELEAASRVKGGTPDILVALGAAYEQAGAYDRALAAYTDAARLDPGNEQTDLGLARVHYAQGEYRQAAEILEQTMQRHPSIPVLRELLADYKKLKRFDQSVETSAALLQREAEHDRQDNARLLEHFRSAGAGEIPDDQFRVKIIRCPIMNKFDDLLDYSLLPPLGIAQIVAYLRGNGLAIEQDDLHIKINHTNMFRDKPDRIDAQLFFDQERILGYAGGKDDPYIDAVMEKVERITPVAGYRVILLSVLDGLDTSGYMFVLAFTKYIRKKYDPVIMIGGADVAIDAMRRYDARAIDYVVKGRGEKILFMLLNALKHRVPVEKIPDITVTGGGRFIDCWRSIWGVQPDFGGLPMDYYRYKNKRALTYADEDTKALIRDFDASGTVVAPFRLMEGCFYECIFCGSSRAREVYALTPQQAVAGLAAIKEKYGIRNFFFLNSVINISKKYINDFCDALLDARLDILWSDCARADNLEPDLLAKMRKAGCIRLIYGMETASPRLLQYVDKRLSLERLEQIVRWTDEAGIWTGVEVICGFPSETRDDLDMTINFINRNRSHIDMVYYNILCVLTRAKLYATPEKYGIENITEAHCRHSRNELTSRMQYAFDEVGGPKWDDKLEKMIEGLDYVARGTNSEEFKFPPMEIEHFLFYLYTRFPDKARVAAAYHKLRRYFKTA